ncbi:sensor histidine kinase [Pseudoxanthomonas wuyuanensis]
MNVRLGRLEVRLSRYLGLWSVVVVVFAMQSCTNDAVNGHLWPPSAYLRWAAIQWLTWAALAPLVFRLGERYPIPFPLRLSRLFRHIGYSLGVTLLAMLIGAAVSSVFEPGGFGQQLGQFISKHMATGLLAYWSLLAIQHLLHFQAEKSRREIEASRLSAELAQSRLQVLKTQLQPHFLFNTLHAIVTLLDEDTLSAEDMLLRLSELLRAFLEDYDGQEISLRRELELLELYLGIQRTRFKDQLTTRIYAAPDVLEAAVPSLVLQPIVENAIRHGIGRHVGTDCIEVDCRRDGDALRIEVRNHNSTLDDSGHAGGHGIGLSNTRLRLHELHGDAAELRLDLMVPRGVACRLRLPFRAIEEADEAPEHVPA